MAATREDPARARRRHRRGPIRRRDYSSAAVPRGPRLPRPRSGADRSPAADRALPGQGPQPAAHRRRPDRRSRGPPADDELAARIDHPPRLRPRPRRPTPRRRCLAEKLAPSPRRCVAGRHLGEHAAASRVHTSSPEHVWSAPARRKEPAAAPLVAAAGAGVARRLPGRGRCNRFRRDRFQRAHAHPGSVQGQSPAGLITSSPSRWPDWTPVR